MIASTIMAPALTIADVERIAALAHLELTAEEKVLFTRQLADILAYARQVQAIETSGVPAKRSARRSANKSARRKQHIQCPWPTRSGCARAASKRTVPRAARDRRTDMLDEAQAIRTRFAAAGCRPSNCARPSRAHERSSVAQRLTDRRRSRPRQRGRRLAGSGRLRRSARGRARSAQGQSLRARDADDRLVPDSGPFCPAL